MTHTITTDQWVWLYISLHTNGLMNGRGYHMSIDSNLCKWAWIRAYLRTDEWMWLPYVCLQTVIYISGRGSQKKQSYAMMCSNMSTFNLARGVRPE